MRFKKNARSKAYKNFVSCENVAVYNQSQVLEEADEHINTVPLCCSVKDILHVCHQGVPHGVQQVVCTKSHDMVWSYDWQSNPFYMEYDSSCSYTFYPEHDSSLYLAWKTWVVVLWISIDWLNDVKILSPLGKLQFLHNQHIWLFNVNRKWYWVANTVNLDKLWSITPLMYFVLVTTRGQKVDTWHKMHRHAIWCNISPWKYTLKVLTMAPIFAHNAPFPAAKRGTLKFWPMLLP